LIKVYFNLGTNEYFKAHNSTICLADLKKYELNEKNNNPKNEKMKNIKKYRK